MPCTIAQERVSSNQKKKKKSCIIPKKVEEGVGGGRIALLIANDTDRESFIRAAECVLCFLLYFICVNLHTSGPDKTAIHTPGEPCEPAGM